MGVSAIFLALVISISAVFPVIAAPSQPLRPAANGHYDEFFERQKDNDGKTIYVVRPQYRDIADVARNLSAQRLAQIESDSLCQFCQENSLSAIPRVVLRSEFEQVIKPGLDQRARALREFLIDFHTSRGRPRFVTEGHMRLATLWEIVRRHDEQMFVGITRPEQISFLYGPDIVRDAKGDLRVQEDNIGNLGGLGDLKIALDALYENVPEYPKLHESEPMDFYRKLIERFRSRAIPKDGKIIFVREPREGDDHENRRIDKILASLGVEVVTKASQLVINDSGVWLRSKRHGPRRRVGFAILRTDLLHLDTVGEIASRHYYYGEILRLHLSEFKAVNEIIKKRLETDVTEIHGSAELFAFVELIDKNGGLQNVPQRHELEAFLIETGRGDLVLPKEDAVFPGLRDAIYVGNVASNYAPGVNFVADKEFYAYVEELIEFYLGEKPILKNIKTWSALRYDGRSKKLVFNKAFLRRMRKSQEDFVIKPADQSGGTGVRVGAHVSREEFAKGLRHLVADPFGHIVQPYVASSMVNGALTDFRPIIDVGPTGPAFVGETLWGRAVSRDRGDGRLNISKAGHEMTVVIRSDSNFCSALFRPAMIF